MKPHEKYFVTGWHHSGTTILQHSIALQLGIPIDSRLREGFFRYKWVPDRVCKVPSNHPKFIDEMRKIMTDKKEDIHVVILIRDANELISSIHRRHSNKELPLVLSKYIKREIENYTKVLKFLVDVFTKSYNNYTVVELRSFAQDPISHLKRLGFKNPLLIEKTSNKERPKDMKHGDLRQWQTRQGINEDVIKPAINSYAEVLDIEKYHAILKSKSY